MSEKLLSLQEEKQRYEARQSMEAYKRSNQSFQEMMTFLLGELGRLWRLFLRLVQLLCWIHYL